MGFTVGAADQVFAVEQGLPGGDDLHIIVEIRGGLIVGVEVEIGLADNRFGTGCAAQP